MSIYGKEAILSMSTTDLKELMEICEMELKTRKELCRDKLIRNFCNTVNELANDHPDVELNIKIGEKTYNFIRIFQNLDINEGLTPECFTYKKGGD